MSLQTIQTAVWQSFITSNGTEITRKQIDEYTQFVGIYGAKGLAWAKVNDINAGLEGVQSPIAKFLNEDVWKALAERVKAQTGDILFFGADKWQTTTDAMGALRLKLGRDLDLTSFRRMATTLGD